jgi:hypothetical protein
MGYPRQNLAKIGGKSMGYVWIKTLIDYYDILDIYIYSICSFLMKVRRLDQRRMGITSIRVARVANQSFSYVEIHSQRVSVSTLS